LSIGNFELRESRRSPRPACHRGGHSSSRRRLLQPARLPHRALADLRRP